MISALKTKHNLPIEYVHRAYLKETIELSQDMTFEYDNRHVKGLLLRTLYPGFYGFTSIETRDKFIRNCNDEYAEECCYIASSIRT